MTTRSLGTLTLDLLARVGGFEDGMDRAERRTRRTMREISALTVAAGNVIAEFTVDAVKGLAGIIDESANAGREINKLASVSGVAARSFQKYAAGAAFVGVEQDKLADIFKDTNDKIGDFLQTGAGPLADFFEQIGPKVGVTADQFAKLSGPQALELYVSSLEKANVSQNEMTFYLEAIASDATLLLPLLRNNAEGFKRLGSEAEAAGAILSEDTLKAANKLDAAMFLLDTSVDGVKNQITEALLPTLTDLIDKFSEVNTEGSAAAAVGDILAKVFRTASAAAAGAIAVFNLAGKSIGGLAATVGAIDLEITDIASPLNVIRKIAKNFDQIKKVGEVAIDDLKATALEAAKTIDSIFEAGKSKDDGQIKSRIDELADLFEKLRKRIDNTGSTLSKTQRENQDQIKTTIKDLQLQVEMLGKTAHEQELYKLQVKGATESQISLAKAALDTVAAFESQAEVIKKAADEQKKINDAAFDISESLLTQEEQIQKSYDRRREIILNNTEITGTAQSDLLKRLEEKRNEELLEINSGFWGKWLASAEENLFNFDELSASVIENFSSQVGDAFESMIFDAQTVDEAFSNLAEGMLRSIVSALGQMAAQWLAYQAIQLLVGKTAQTRAVTTMTANAAATSLQAGLAAYASTAAIPIVGPFAAPSAMAAALAATGPMIAAIAASASSGLAGMAHDGIDSVPQTGSWWLKKGERVTTAETSAKLDSTLSDIRRNQIPMDNQRYGNVRIVNTFDRDEVVGGWIGSSAGERAIMNVVKNNRGTIRTISQQG